MKIRHICAVLGIAIAAGAVIFMRSLVTTNDFQAFAQAERLLREVPVESTAQVLRGALDYRPDGRVMQGPPLMVSAATVSHDAPSFGSARVTRALFLQRGLTPPPVGTELKLICSNGVKTLKIESYLPWERSVRGYPNLFVSEETAKSFHEKWQAFDPKGKEELAPLFMTDSQRNFDRSRFLLVWAAVLTSLALLVTTMLLAIESRRREIAVWRLLGMTKRLLFIRIAVSSFVLALAGVVFGLLGSALALKLFVVCWPEDFSMGVKFCGATILIVFILVPILSVLAALLALRPALRVKPLELAARRAPRRHPWGMIVSFAFAFGSFIAVEVWGASLMSAFVPSPEWPDAIVSILPGGVSSFEIEKLRRIEGVRMIAELQPLQVNFEPLCEHRNALLLASDYLPHFKFVEGTYEEAVHEIAAHETCVITEMMARARGLKKGDILELDCGQNFVLPLKVVGVVDLNWHLVTSRGLVRGLNRMPVQTDGPLFVSFDTLAAADIRPQEFVKMTHLWLDFEDAFEEKYGPFVAGRRVESAIASALGCKDDNTIRAHVRDEVSDGTLAHGAELIGSMAAVPFLFLIVLSLGFVSLLVSETDVRREELVVLRVLGASRVQIAAQLVFEVLQIAACGLVLGLLGGSLVGWLSTSATRAAMANWGIPPAFVLPVSPVMLGGCAALVVTFLIAFPTALLLLRKKGSFSS